MKTTKFYLPLAISVIFMAASCGESPETGDTETEQQTTEEPTTEAPAETEEGQSEATADTVRLEINGNDQMQYDKDRMRVKAGQVVVLTLNHVGEMPKDAMGHNWVLLEKGIDRASFAQDAVEAQDNHYIPQDREDEVIAHTEMLGGGESDTITFEAPAKGIYSFLCTFPGHYMQMNGKLIVE